MPDVVMLVIAAGVLVLAGFGYARLGRKPPRYTVLLVALAFLITSASYEPAVRVRQDATASFTIVRSGPLMLLDATIGAIGFLGLIMGLVIFFRRKTHERPRPGPRPGGQDRGQLLTLDTPGSISVHLMVVMARPIRRVKRGHSTLLTVLDLRLG